MFLASTTSDEGRGGKHEEKKVREGTERVNEEIHEEILESHKQII